LPVIGDAGAAGNARRHIVAGVGMGKGRYQEGQKGSHCRKTHCPLPSADTGRCYSRGGWLPTAFMAKRWKYMAFFPEEAPV
jgi:hypothetical protein